MRRLPVLLCALLVCASCSEPPQKEIDRAQGAIDAARAAGAERYATSEFAAATTALQQAHEAVNQRDYRLALSRALDASERAQEAARQAADGMARARSEADAAVHEASTALTQMQTRLKAPETTRLPAAVVKEAKQTSADAERALQKARAALKQGAYADASAAVKGVAERIAAGIRAMDQAGPTRPARPAKRRR